LILFKFEYDSKILFIIKEIDNLKKEMDSSLLTSQVYKLSSLIAYSKDSVVSKTLINKDSGTITLFSFDKDQGLSEHKAPYDALVYIIKGDMLIGIEENNFTVKTGETILLPANKMHSLKAISKSKMFLVMIKESKTKLTV